MQFSILTIVCIALFATCVTGFQLRQPRCMVSVKGHSFVQLQRHTALFVAAADDDDAAESTGNTAPVKSDPGISNDMRQRLLRENASFGGDANSKSSNPILIVAAVVGVLAIASSLIGAL